MPKTALVELSKREDEKQPSTDAILTAIFRLYGWLSGEHWDGNALVGPDSGIRLNSRVTRFVKSYTSLLPWSDNLIYLQAQGYWIESNWELYSLSGRDSYRERIILCARFILSRQTREGYWPYPNPEWKGRIATVEGCYACLGLLRAYECTGSEQFLQGALRWYRYLIEKVGFEGANGKIAIKYFANQTGKLMVPNNTTLVLKTVSKLCAATSDSTYLDRCDEMIAWLRDVQLESGELPYSVAAGPGLAKDRPHFLCYQYNAFELLDLLEYFKESNESSVWTIMVRLAEFLRGGVLDTGAARFDCHHDRPEVTYYSAALGAALSQAAFYGVIPPSNLGERCYSWVLQQQKSSGNFNFFSRFNYGIFADRRSYPRNLAMILFHLLLQLRKRNASPALKERPHSLCA